MAITVLPIDASAGAPAYSAQHTRQAFSAFLGPAPTGRPVGAISGVRPGTPSTTVSLSGTGSMTWNVAAHAGVIDGEPASAGPYLYATDGTDTGTITAANATNPRVDIIYVRVDDADQDASGLRGGTVGYLSGTPAATPYAPATPARSIVIADINVPASGGGAPTVSWVAPVFADTGWITLPSVLTGGGVYYRVTRGVVYIVIDGVVTTVSGTVLTVSTSSLPVALRPVNPAGQLRAGGYFGGFPGTITVDNTGTVTAVQNSGANRATVAGSLSYPVS